MCIAENFWAIHYTFRKTECMPITVPKHESIKKVYVEMVRNVVEAEVLNRFRVFFMNGAEKTS